jgi:putative component of toxin-antitoxin plasmid stabilization module
MTEGSWSVEFYADYSGRQPCRVWAEKLSPVKKAAFLAAVGTVLTRQGSNVAGTEFGKNLGAGLYELRIRQTADEIRQRVGDLPIGREGTQRNDPPEVVLLRVFFCTSGRKVIVLLSGYDKGANPSGKRQQKAIADARKLLTAHREARKRGRNQSAKSP